jgi:ribosomal protein S12 methylthiotransferase accessory factor
MSRRDPLESLVSPYVGVVRGVQEVLAGPQDVRLSTTWCESAHAGALVGAAVAHIGGGSGPSLPAARAAAIGEAVERYSACFADPDRLVVATARELGRRAVDPARFALFTATQYALPRFPYVPFTRDTELAWIECRSLPGGEAAWLPAQVVHLAPARDEPPICRATSSGLACHTKAETATLVALLELLERDAFMITWRTRLSWPRLDWTGHAPLEQFADTRLRPTGLDVHAIDLSAFWEIPCVLGVARSTVPGDAPVGVGAAAAATIERAVVKALDEAVRVRSWANALQRVGVPMPTEIRDFDDHIRFYAEPSNASGTLFLDASHERRHALDVPTLAAPHLDALCGRLARRSASAYAVDVTSPDVREAGLTVMRVVVPELCALDVEHGAQLLGGRRLYDEPVRLGFGRRPLNPDPHPFP